MIFFGVVLVFGLAACALILFVAWAANTSDDDLQALNQNRGGQSDPILANEIVYFQDYNVLPLYYLRPATELVRSFNVVNRPPTGGRDYVLIRFKLECTKPPGRSCSGGDLNVRIIDENGQDWGRPVGILLLDNLEGEDVISGAVVEGWSLVEFPQDRRPTQLRLWDNHQNVLYTQLPRQQSQ
jgi:hypothetical protein